MSKKPKDFLITRHDHNFFHGWVVSTMRRGRRWQKYFNDKPHGRAASLRQARAFRDRLLEQLPPPTRVHKRSRRNTTGIVGVSLSRERTRQGTILERYNTSWTAADGRKRKVSFSVAKYGRAKARRFAVEARKKVLAELIGEAWWRDYFSSSIGADPQPGRSTSAGDART